MSTAAPRRPASAIRAIEGLLILPMNIKATLIDISTSGLLAELDATLRVGQWVKVTFKGTFEPRCVDAQVVRSNIGGMTSTGVRYLIGFSFKLPLPLPPLPGQPAPDGGSQANSPAGPADADPKPEAAVNRW